MVDVILNKCVVNTYFAIISCIAPFCICKTGYISLDYYYAFELMLKKSLSRELFLVLLLLHFVGI